MIDKKKLYEAALRAREARRYMYQMTHFRDGETDEDRAVAFAEARNALDELIYGDD